MRKLILVVAAVAALAFGAMFLLYAAGWGAFGTIRQWQMAEIHVRIDAKDRSAVHLYAEEFARRHKFDFTSSEPLSVTMHNGVPFIMGIVPDREKPGAYSIDIAEGGLSRADAERLWREFLTGFQDRFPHIVIVPEDMNSETYTGLRQHVTPFEYSDALRKRP